MTVQYLIVLGLLEGFVLVKLYEFFPLVCLSVLMVQAVVLRRRFNQRAVLAFGLAIAVGFFYAEAQLPEKVSFRPQNVYLRLKTEDIPTKVQNRYTVEGSGVLRGLRTKVVLPFEVPPGSAVEGLVRVSVRSPRLNPGMGFQEPYLVVRPLRAQVILPESPPLRWRLYRAMKENFSPEVSELFLALTIGKRPSQDLYRDYSRAGLAHLLAISGAHFGFISLFCFVLLRAAMKLTPYKLLLNLSRWVSLRSLTAVVVVAVLSFYLYISGARVPTLRAYVMFVLFSLGLILGRANQWLYVLAVSAVVVLALEPGTVLGPSFLLSYTAVLTIGLVWQHFKDSPLARGHWLKRTFWGYSLTTLAAFLGTLPLVVYFFHGFSPLSPVVNLFVVPLFSFVLLPGLFVWTVVYALTGWSVLIGPLEALGRVFSQTVHCIAGWDLSYIQVPQVSVYATLVMYGAGAFLFYRKYLYSMVCAGIALLVLIGAPRVCTPPMVTFLDAGQADTAVVETPKATLVVDTARTGIETSAYLRYRAVEQIDALLLSHSAADHAGGLDRLLRDFKVRSLWISHFERPKDIPEDTEVLTLSAGDKLLMDGINFVVLHPPEGFVPDNENNACLVLKMDTGGLSVLFTADAEAQAEKTMLRYPTEFLRADVLKVAHHGSRTSSGPEFVRAVSPEVSVISVGRHNPYAHPSALVLQRLQHTKVFRTDRDGALRVCREGNTLKLYRWQDFVLKVAVGSPKEEVQNLWRLLLRW